uniref:ER lumen protein-retaining receptor n=1 Tax=Anas platyrhynchos platyrhynchos TaxID=8840 RepID=U3J4A1_ANAPP
ASSSSSSACLASLLAYILFFSPSFTTQECLGFEGKAMGTGPPGSSTSSLLLPSLPQVIFLICAYVTVYMIYVRFRKTFDSENDSFRLEFLLVPVTGLAFLENHSFTPLEILWTFSIYLESVAILPQLFMISKTGEAETITTHYLFFLGLYRALYIANWVWRYHTEKFYDQIAVVSGVVQTIFYCDFFYLYVTKVLKGKKLSLPMPV